MSFVRCKTCHDALGTCGRCQKPRNEWKKGFCGGKFGYGCRGTKRHFVRCDPHKPTEIHCDGCGLALVADRTPEGWSDEWRVGDGGRQHWCPSCTSTRAMALDYAAELNGGGGDSLGAIERRKQLEAQLLSEAVRDVLAVAKRVLTSEGNRTLTSALQALGSAGREPKRVEVAVAKALEIPF